MNLFENLQIMKESTDADFVKQECEKYGIIGRSYGTNYAMLELEPTDEAATEFTNKIEADGYKLITTQKDGVEGDESEDDVTLVYGKEIEDKRCIIAVSIHPSENSVIVSCGYDEQESDNEFFESKEEPEEIIEWDEDVFDDQYDDGEDKTEAAIVKDEKDMEMVVEQAIEDKEDVEFEVEEVETLTEDLADPKEALQVKANRFGAMVDALGEEMSEFELNEFLKGLTDELDMDIYEEGEPYPSDLEGYLGMDPHELDMEDEETIDLINWIDGIVTDCTTKTVEFIKGKIETLKGEISALETSIKDLESLL